MIFIILNLLISSAETQARGVRVRSASEPTGFEGEGFLVELPAQGGNLLMSGIGTFVIYPVLFYGQGLAGGFSSDKSWGTAKNIATSTFGFLGYYTFGTPFWLIKKLLWDLPLFFLGAR